MPAISIQEKKAALLGRGFIIGDRNELINTAFPGKFMVAQEHTESELPTADGSQGPWAIVGDNLDELIDDAYAFWTDTD